MATWSKEVFAKNLRRYMETKKISQKELAVIVGVSAPTINEWVKAKKYPRIDKIEILSNYFGCLKSDLIEEPFEPYNPIVHKIPILGYISAGMPLYAEEQIEGYTYTERNGGEEYFALRVKGDSMNALSINDGSLLIVRRQEEVENGEIAVVKVNGENATVKRFRQDGNIVQLIPQSFNPEHQIQFYNLKNTEVVVIGKVVECKIEF